MDNETCRYRYYTNEVGNLGGDKPKCKIDAPPQHSCLEVGEASCQLAIELIKRGVRPPTIAQVAGLQPRSLHLSQE